MSQFNVNISVHTFLDKLPGMDVEPLKRVMEMFGGRDFVINTLVEYFSTESESKKLGNEQIKEVVMSILFDCSGNDTYKEDWNSLWDTIKDLPLSFLVEALLTYPPGRLCDDSADVALSYILWNKYGTNEVTAKIYEELKDHFDDDIPHDFSKFVQKKHFVDELLLFNDLNYIEENFKEIDFDKEEILQLLKQVALTRKLDSYEKFSKFIRLINWYKPQNVFAKKYGDAFVLEIYEVDDESGIEMWSDSIQELWQEEFYNIDFSTSSEWLKEVIAGDIKKEADHISEQLKINPLYRHD